MHRKVVKEIDDLVPVIMKQKQKNMKKRDTSEPSIPKAGTWKCCIQNGTITPYYSRISTVYFPKTIASKDPLIPYDKNEFQPAINPGSSPTTEYTNTYALPF